MDWKVAHNPLLLLHSTEVEEKLYGHFSIIRSLASARQFFINSLEFVLCIGIPKYRKLLSDKLIAEGGKLISIIAKLSSIGHYNVLLSEGLNIMQNVLISNSVEIGKGMLINAFVSVHHDVIIGEYCEVSPHAALLGGCKIGNYSSIGSNATILPDIRIGDSCIIGAGSVVTKNIPDNSLVVGIPGRIIKSGI